VFIILINLGKNNILSLLWNRKIYWYNKVGGQSGGVTMNSPRLEKEQG